MISLLRKQNFSHLTLDCIDKDDLCEEFKVKVKNKEIKINEDTSH